MNIKKTNTFIALLFMIMLAVSSLTVTPKVSPFSLGAPDNVVSNETELRNAIDYAQTEKSTVIALNKDITLTESSIFIPAYKDITLTSNKSNGYYKLICAADGNATLGVGEGGILRLDGIIVTHAKGTNGRGVSLGPNCQFFMYNGEISGNIDNVAHTSPIYGMYAGEGGGVYIGSGSTFTMAGGEISNNTAPEGAVCLVNGATFIMTGGKISNNLWSGVYNRGNHANFTMSGGEISGNTGSGVYNSATFIMTGGKIVGNTGGQGGGVNNEGTFTMSGGTISGNTATYGGGVYNNRIFNIQGGVISGNTATYGNNVYPDNNNDGLGSNDNSSNGNGNARPSADNNGGTNNDNNEQIIGNFSLRDVIIIGVGVVGIIMGIIGTVLFLASKKQLNP